MTLEMIDETEEIDPEEAAEEAAKEDLIIVDPPAEA